MPTRTPPMGGFYNGTVYDAETHAVITAFNYSTLSAVSPLYAVSMTNSTLQATAVADNQVLWSFAGDGALDTPPIIVSNYVFVGSSSGNLYGLDAASGTVQCTRALGAAIPPSASGGLATQGQSGLSAGDGYLVVPAGTEVDAFLLSARTEEAGPSGWQSDRLSHPGWLPT